MLNDTEREALAKLRTVVALLNLPIRVDHDPDTGTVTVHFTALITAPDEAHLLNVLSHGAGRYRLDAWQGPVLPPEMVRERTAQWVAAHPTARSGAR